jgi:phosphatidylserine synthase
MFITAGEELFGIVDQVPGHFYIATRFFHICSLPIAPFQSYLVVEGSEVDPTIFRQGSFSGVPIGWNLRSILIGWFRGALMFLVVVGFVVGLIALLIYQNEPLASRDPLAYAIGVGGVAGAPVFLMIYVISRRSTRATQTRLESLAQSLATRYPAAARIVEDYLQAQPVGGESVGEE